MLTIRLSPKKIIHLTLITYKVWNWEKWTLKLIVKDALGKYVTQNYCKFQARKMYISVMAVVEFYGKSGEIQKNFII